MDFRVLGTVAVWSAGQRVPMTGALRTALLALLLLRANRVVPADWLIDTLWESAPPRTAPSSLQVMVHHLRRTLSTEQDRLVTRAPGYLLKVGDSELDLHVFTSLVAGARTALSGRAYPQAAGDLRRALALWTGPVLGGATGVRLLRDEAARLDELRLAALEDRIGADLALGQAADLVDELTGTVAVHPTRERLRGQLMLALYRCERTADALAAYRAGRRMMVRDLGIEPGKALQDLHARILRGDRRLLNGPDQAGERARAAAPAVPVPPAPAELPHDVPQFTGRETELAVLAALGDPPDGRPAPVIAIDGMPGVGKTALALRFAHQIARRWPDGQLYLNLHGFDPGQPPTPPGEALYHLLTTLGVAPAGIPDGVDERAARYRSVLAGRRILLMLDNAASVGQVRPLLPGGAGGPVIVTSRNRLSGLVVHDGAHLVTVEPLSTQDSLALLHAVLGPGRIGAEPDAARELLRRNGFLPLALRISAANLLANPGRTVADFVAELAASPLDALRVDGDDQSATRPAFDASYRSLPADLREQFCLLGTAPGGDLSGAAVAALSGSGPARAGADLDRLQAAHLVEEYLPGRWRQHDLLRRYAAECAERDLAEPDRVRALARLVEHYLDEVGAATRLLFPHAPAPAGGARTAFPSTGAAVAWFDAERTNLVSAARYAAAASGAPLCWQLTDAMARLYLLRAQPRDWLAAGREALAAAIRADAPEGVAHLHLALGNACFSAGDNSGATGHYATAIEYAERVGWQAGQAAAQANLGVIHAVAGRPLAALDHYRRALDLHRTIGGRYGEAVALDNIGGVQFQLGQVRDALDQHRAALRIHRETGYAAGQGLALANIANALRELGDLDAASGAGEQALAIYQGIGSRTGEAQVSCCLADILTDAGRTDEAWDAAAAALGATETSGDERTMSEALNILGTLCAARKELNQAAAYHERALTLATGTGYQMEVQEALLGLAAVHRHRGEYAEAARHARRALSLARAGRNSISLAAVLAELADIHRARGVPGAAAARLRTALRIAAENGQHPRHERIRAALAELG